MNNYPSCGEDQPRKHEKMPEKRIFSPKIYFQDFPKIYYNTTSDSAHLVPAIPARSRTQERTKMTSRASRAVKSILLKNSIFGT